MAKKQTIPSHYLSLGLAGLIPFIVCLIGLASGQSAILAWSKVALVGYGALILSFLGGIKWGLLLNERSRKKQSTALLIGIVPVLFGWASLLFNTTLGLSLLVIGFGLQYYFDRLTVEEGHAPRWYARLRRLLTVLVELLLLTALGVLWFEFQF